MSSNGSIKIVTNDFRLSSKQQFFDEMKVNGWKFEANNEVVYLLDNEDDLFNWIHEDKSNVNEIIKRVVHNLELGKDVGISMSFKDSEFGWLVLIENDFKTFNFCLEVGRKLLGNTDITDFSWHLAHIVPTLLLSGFSIERIDCDWG